MSITPFLSVYSIFILTYMQQIIRISEVKLTTKAENNNSAIICTKRCIMGNIKEKYQGQYVTISNQLIRAKETTDLFESKIEDLGIKHMDMDMFTTDHIDAEGNPYVRDTVQIRASEIRELSSRTGGSLYEDIYDAALQLKQKLVIVRDKKSNQFVMKSLYGDVSYDNGILTIEYNPDTEYLFLQRKGDFTKLPMPILFSFKTNGGYQLYKLLKSYAYNLPALDMNKDQDELPVYPVTYTLANLRMEMGLVDINQPKLRAEGEKKHPNFAKMEKEEVKPRYKRWSDFNTRVLSPGVKEINDMPSDIFIKEVATDSTGKGSRVTELTFYIQHNKSYYMNEARAGYDSSIMTEDGIEIVNESPEYTFEQISQVRDIIKKIKISQINANNLLIVANGNIELIKKCYKKALRQSDIKDFMGWMITAIRNEGYDDPVPMMEGSTERAEKVRVAREQMEEPGFNERMWQKIKEKDDFNEFLNYIGCTTETIEITYDDPRERAGLYADWKIGRLKL